MTNDRDVERLLGQWLGEGPTEVPDRVIDVVADRIGRQPQRPAWRFHWRPSAMTPKRGAAAALAAVVIVAIGAMYFLRPSTGTGVGGQNPTGSPSAVASPTAASPSPSASPNAISSVTFKPTLNLVAPAGWTAGDGARTFILDAPAEPSGAGLSVGIMSGPFVTFNDHDCEDRAPAGVGTSSAKVIATLGGDARLVATSAQPVTVGDRTGQMLDIQVAPSWTGTCGWSGGKPAVLILSATDTGPAFGIGGTERARYMFLDVGGSVVAINFSTPDGTGFDALVAQVTPIVESMRFTP